MSTPEKHSTIGLRARAEAVANENLRRLEQPVLRPVAGRLRAGGIILDQADLEAAYNQAWHGVYQAILQGRAVENLTGLLIDITYKRAIDAYRQRNEAMHIEADLADHPVEVDIEGQLDDQRKIDRLIERLKDRLNINERNAVTLCVIHGYTRPEAAERLGIAEPAFQKIMDAATKKIAMITGGIEAQGCGGEEWARALRAYALGVTAPDQRDYLRISEHIEQCGSCRRYVMGLRGLAALLPPILPAGHAVATGGLLGFLRNLLSPAQKTSTAAAASTTSTTSTLSSTASTVATSTAASSSSGLASALGAAKAAVVVAGVAAAGTVSVVHFAAHHTPAARANTPSPTSVISPASRSNMLLDAPAQSYAPPRKHQQQPQRHRHRRHRAKSAPVPSSTAVVPQIALQPVPRASVASSSPAPSAPQQETSGEFGIEPSK